MDKRGEARRMDGAAPRERTRGRVRMRQEHLDQLFAVTNGATTTLWAVYGNTVASFALR